uniref:C-type lectin domain-containing protein n=1 Tax=Amphiprion percula TaxID=161767 RepID=A0A3P8RRP3_AMPPE
MCLFFCPSVRYTSYMLMHCSTDTQQPVLCMVLEQLLKTARENILSLSYSTVTMERTIVFVFLCIAVEGDLGKHIFIQNKVNWTEAQAYCRRYHTDLSYFNSQSDIEKLRKDAGGKIYHGWIGLQKDPNNSTAWMWSGGGHITYQNWACPIRKRCGVLTNEGLWENRDCQEKLYFIFKKNKPKCLLK